MLFTSPQGKNSHNTSTKAGRETEIVNRMLYAPSRLLEAGLRPSFVPKRDGRS